MSKLNNSQLLFTQSDISHVDGKGKEHASLSNQQLLDQAIALEIEAKLSSRLKEYKGKTGDQ